MAAGLSGLGRGSSAAATAEGPGTTATCGTTTILPAINSDNIVLAGCTSDDEVAVGDRVQVEVEWQNDTGFDILFDATFGLQVGDGDIQWITSTDGVAVNAGETATISKGIRTNSLGLEDIGEGGVEVTPHAGSVNPRPQ